MRSDLLSLRPLHITDPLSVITKIKQRILKLNIIILGNGFDLSHGLKTRYSHFFDFLSNSSNRSAEVYKKLFERKKIAGASTVKLIKNQLYNRMEKANKKNWCDIESFYYEELLKSKDPERLNSEFQEIKNALYAYLKTQNDASKPLEGYKHLFAGLKAKNVVINFNYTSTHNHYSDSFEKVINIHGQLDNLQNYPIFGYAANQTETLKLLEKNNDHYLENIKQYEYLNANNFSEIKFLLSKHQGNILILGHSCGLSDQLLLKTIFENNNFHKIFNFYYKNITSHKIRLININRTTNEDTGFQKFVSFPNSLRMPQSDSDLTQEQVQNFLKINENVL